MLPPRPAKTGKLGLLAATVVMLAGIGGCSQEDPLNNPGVIELSEAFEGEFDLVDHDGAPASDERFEGKPIFAYYGFASCPDVCPAALSVMSASLDAMGSDAGNVQPLFITVDPERDTPEVLKAHLAFDDRILGLTGTSEAAEAARKSMKVYAARVELEDSAMEYTMNHQDLFYVLDDEGTPVLALETSMAPQDIASVLKLWIS